MDACKQTGSETADSTQHKNHLHPFNKLYDQRNIKTKINQLNSVRLIKTPSIVNCARSCSSFNLETHVSVRSDVVSNIWTAVPISTASFQLKEILIFGLNAAFQ